MVCLAISPGRLVHYGDWLTIRDRLAAETESAFGLIDGGVYDATSLVPTAWRHPGDPRAYAIGWAIDPLARPRPKATQYRWRRALGVVWEAAIDDLTLADAIEAARRRFPATTRLDGWEQAAERVHAGWRFWVPAAPLEVKPAPITFDLVGTNERAIA